MIAAVLAATWSVIAAPASATDVAVGVCKLKLDVSGAYVLLPDAEVPPAPRTTLAITGEGTCTVNGELNVPMTVSGTVDFPVDVTNWTCLAGVGVGLVRFDVAPTKFAIDVLASTTVVAVAPGVSLSAAHDDPGFAATGQFVQDIASSTTCPLSGSTTATWCGVLEFVATKDALPPTSDRGTPPQQ